jgi:hypothetical protein
MALYNPKFNTSVKSAIQYILILGDIHTTMYILLLNSLKTLLGEFSKNILKTVLKKKYPRPILK